MTSTASDRARNTPTRALALELTKGCNLRCGYCYYAQREEAYDPRSRMSPEVVERSVELLLAEGPPEEPIHLHFFGGEPLLSFPLLQHAVDYAERRSAEEGREVTFEVTTNGTRFDDEVVRFLNDHHVRVGVSFDGPPEVQDVSRPAASGSSYAMAEPGIRRLLASRAETDLDQHTHCSVVVTRSAFDLVALVRHLEGLGFRRILLTPATDLAGETNGFREVDLPEVLAAYDALADDYERRVAAGEEVSATWFPTLMGRLQSGERREQYCQGGRDYLGVAADGSLALCYRFYEDEGFQMGSVQEGVDREVTERLLERPVDERTTCSSCWARHFCGGGCHHENVTVGGELGEPNPITCEILRHSMGRTLEAWARLSHAGHLDARKKVEASGPSMDAPPENAPGPFADEDRPRRVPGAHVRELQGESVVYDPATHEVVVLNPTASLIFELCDGEHSVASILAELERRYDAPEDVLGRDLGATLAELRAKRLVS